MLRRLLRRGCACLLYPIIVAVVLAIVILFYMFVRAEAGANGVESSPLQATDAPTYDVVLLSDQSLSMWDCDGQGSDPKLLRVDATHLFLNYLGADSNNERFRIGLVHFGGEAHQMAPLTDISDAAVRQRLIDVASDPEPIPWTNQLIALEEAQRMFEQSGQLDSRRVVVLLTDGEPIAADNSPIDKERYSRALRNLAGEYSQQAIDLFIIQLANPNTTCNQRVIAEWMTLWQEVAATTPQGEVHTAGAAADLLPIYHAIVRDLIVRDTGHATDSRALVDAESLAPGEEMLVHVPVQGNAGEHDAGSVQRGCPHGCRDLRP